MFGGQFVGCYRRIAKLSKIAERYQAWVKEVNRKNLWNLELFISFYLMK